MRSPPPYLKTGRRTWWNCTMCIGGPSASGSLASGCASWPGLPEREGARGEHVRVHPRVPLRHHQVGEVTLGTRPACRGIACMDRLCRRDHIVNGIAQRAYLGRDQLRERATVGPEHRRAREKRFDCDEPKRLVPRGRVPQAPGTREQGRLGGAVHLTHELDRSRERSEEHTSELQSPCNLVCRLLLEKKKK